MAASNLIDLSGLMDDAKCFTFVRQRRWPEGVRCPGCGSDVVIRDGATMLNPIGSGIGARRAPGASTISPVRRWPAATSRCGSGCCASTSWA